MNDRLNVSAVVLTYNEASNVRHCLESVRGLCDVFVLDSGSDDGTVEICREYTPHVFYHAFTNHPTQWQWAFEHLPLTTDWILAMDADFVVSPELRRRIAREIDGVPDHVAGDLHSPCLTFWWRRDPLWWSEEVRLFIIRWEGPARGGDWWTIASR